MKPILYSFRRCPYAMRARMSLILSSSQCEIREILLKQKPVEMLEISPKGTVPVLQLADKILDAFSDFQDIQYFQSVERDKKIKILCTSEILKLFFLYTISIFIRVGK